MKRARRIPLRRPGLTLHARPTRASARWRPLTLAWRSLSRAAMRRAHVHRANVRNQWSPRFTVQLKLGFIVPAQTKRLSIATSFASAIVRRHWLTHLTALRQILQRPPGAADRLRVDRILRNLAARDRLIRTATQTEVRRIFKTRPPPAPAARAAGRSVESAPGARRTRSFPAVELISMRRSHHMLRTSRHVAHATTATRLDLVLAPGRLAPVQGLSRAPELVWRADGEPVTLDAIERSISAATSSAVPFGGPNPPQVEQLSGPHGSPAAGKLDPALLDRVAEDVIGRVERRIRIERERRGV